MQTNTPVNTCDIKIKWVTDHQCFYDLKKDWNQLARQCGPAFYFRHEWFESAWHWVKQKATLKILTAFHQDQLIAILPLMLKHSHYKGIPYRSAEFLSIPDTQICDLIILPKYQKVKTYILNTLLEDKSWDKLKLHYLPEQSQISQFADFFPHTCFLQATTHHPAVRIHEPWEDYYQTKSRRLKKGNNLCRNHLEKSGLIRVENLSYLPYETLLNIVQHISKNSWKQSTRTTFDQAGPYEFIKALTKLAKENNWLNLWVLKLNSEVIAYEYQIEFENQIHALRSDYLNTYGSFSPGTYLNWKILENLFAQKKSIYYMGPGENQYKLRWSNQSKPVYTFTLYHKTLLGHIIKTMEQNIVPKIRPIKNQISSLLKQEIQKEEIQ